MNYDKLSLIIITVLLNFELNFNNRLYIINIINICILYMYIL